MLLSDLLLYSVENGQFCGNQSGRDKTPKMKVRAILDIRFRNEKIFASCILSSSSAFHGRTAFVQVCCIIQKPWTLSNHHGIICMRKVSPPYPQGAGLVPHHPLGIIRWCLSCAICIEITKDHVLPITSVWGSKTHSGRKTVEF